MPPTAGTPKRKPLTRGQYALLLQEARQEAAARLSDSSPLHGSDSIGGVLPPRTPPMPERGVGRRQLEPLIVPKPLAFALTSATNRHGVVTRVNVVDVGTGVQRAANSVTQGKEEEDDAETGEEGRERELQGSFKVGQQPPAARGATTRFLSPTTQAQINTKRRPTEQTAFHAFAASSIRSAPAEAWVPPKFERQYPTALLGSEHLRPRTTTTAVAATDASSVDSVQMHTVACQSLVRNPILQSVKRVTYLQVEQGHGSWKNTKGAMNAQGRQCLAEAADEYTRERRSTFLRRPETSSVSGARPDHLSLQLSPHNAPPQPNAANRFAGPAGEFSSYMSSAVLGREKIPFTNRYPT